MMIQISMGQIIGFRKLIFVALLALTACGRPLASHPNVLVLAVEGWGPEDLPCSTGSRPEVQSGFDWLCQEGQTFDALHSNSEFSNPSLASFLFGLTPDQLKLQNNNEYVRAESESFAEQAFDKGWATAFFGSTPLFLRRSGLAQGFELFTESTQIEAQRWGKGRDQIIQDFLRWRTEQGRSSFYAVLTFSDLNFPWRPVISLAGQERARTVESQVEALGESWLALFRQMQQQKIWDSTWIVAVGLQGRGTGFNRLRIAAVVKPPKGMRAEFPESLQTLPALSNEIHSRILHLDRPGLDSEEKPSVSNPLAADAGGFWVHSNGSPLRSQILRKWTNENPTLAPWLQLEWLEQNRSQEFIYLAKTQGPADAVPFWDRVLHNHKTQILQDPCLRMVDLKIFEGGGAKTCDSTTLLALQEWFRQIEAGADEGKIREARARTLRSLHELRSLRRIHLVNWALGSVVKLSPQIGNEILRTEMALRLPDLRTTKTWLDQAESSVIEKTE